jgi:hypothetical protein
MDIKVLYNDANSKKTVIISDIINDKYQDRMKSIVLTGIICIVIASCGNHKVRSEKVTSDSLIAQENNDSFKKTEPQFDGDPNVSGSTEHIESIMKSIAYGDVKTLASLTIYPIERRYPLHNIVDSSDMIKRFNQIFDQKFRDRMKLSKASDWHSYGWRGYSYGEDNSLWVYDLLTVINYYSPQEKALYDQLVKKEMASLHESLRGNGWNPFCCYMDMTDGSIVRVDVRARKAMRDEIFHVSGDDKFRMSIYPKGYNLMGKPLLVLNGNVNIEGSANIMDYCFKNGETKIEFGDASFENGKELLRITKNGKETMHEIKPCYWLDLNK